MKKILKTLAILIFSLLLFICFIYCIGVAIDGQIEINEQKELNYIYEYNSYNNFKN